MQEQQKNLQKYAKEYYLMGNECITHMHDTRAALANYDKAIELYPDYADAWVRKGVTLFNADRINEAEACLDKLYVCARWNLKPFITAENCVFIQEIPKELLPTSTKLLP